MYVRMYVLPFSLLFDLILMGEGVARGARALGIFPREREREKEREGNSTLR